MKGSALLIILILALPVYTGCPDTALSGSGVVEDDGEVTTEEEAETTTVSGTYYTITDTDFFYTASLEIAPVVTTQPDESDEYPDSEFLSEIYNAMREYAYPRDEGVIDMHNIFKLSYTAYQIYENGVDDCDPIEDQTIRPPFDFGIERTYNCAGDDGTMDDEYANAYAIKEDNGKRYAILTFRWASSEHGVMQGEYDETTGDLLLHMVELVDHDESHFYVRSYLEGNAETHIFKFKMVTGSIYDDSDYTSIAGYGTSKDNGNHFLFKIETGDEDMKYFCIPAEPTLEEILIMDSENPNGSDSVDSECASYAGVVNDEDFTFLDHEDVPTEMSDFTGSSILLEYDE